VIQRTLIILKPDALERSNEDIKAGIDPCTADQIMDRFKNAGIGCLHYAMIDPTHDENGKILKALKELYAEHEGKDFYQRNIDHMMSGALLLLAVEGENCVQVVRDMIGNKDPSKAEKGTIRGDFGGELPKNLIHASDSVESADRELNIWFPHLDAVIRLGQMLRMFSDELEVDEQEINVPVGTEDIGGSDADPE